VCLCVNLRVKAVRKVCVSVCMCLHCSDSACGEQFVVEFFLHLPDNLIRYFLDRKWWEKHLNLLVKVQRKIRGHPRKYKFKVFTSKSICWTEK